MIKKFFREQPLYKVIMDIVFIVIALSGIAVSIYMNVVGRSLWYDEAALAYSFVRRGFSELTATGLDLVQSAPVGWLYAVKILCKIFGYSDFVMRVPSILAYIGCLVLVYYVAKKILKLYYAFAPVAFAASLPLFLQYSNMFKPYISDAFLALLAVVLFYIYKERKLNVYLLGVIWGVMIWFSSPVCFVEGGIIIASFIVSLMSKDKIKIKQDIINLLKIGVIIVVFFAVYYFYWLRKVDGDMHAFWGEAQFKLLPLSLDDLRDNKYMMSLLLEPFYSHKIYIAILCLIGFILSIIKKNEYVLSTYTIFIFTAIVSTIGMYPVNKRLWLFIYPLLILSCFYVLDFLLDKADLANSRSTRNILVGVALVCMCITNSGIRYYMHKEYIYWPRYEVKGEMEYMDSVIEKDDGVYVLLCARPAFLFYNNYNTDTLEATGNSVLVGEHLFCPDLAGYEPDHTDEFNYILSHDKCYIVTSDTWNDDYMYTYLFERLSEEGTIEMVYDKYATPLFLFTKNK